MQKLIHTELIKAHLLSRPFSLLKGLARHTNNPICVEAHVYISPFSLGNAHPYLEFHLGYAARIL